MCRVVLGGGLLGGLCDALSALGPPHFGPLLSLLGADHHPGAPLLPRVFLGPAPALSWHQFLALQKDRESPEGVTPPTLGPCGAPQLPVPPREGSGAGHCPLHSAAWTPGATWEEGLAKAARVSGGSRLAQEEAGTPGTWCCAPTPLRVAEVGVTQTRTRPRARMAPSEGLLPQVTTHNLDRHPGSGDLSGHLQADSWAGNRGPLCQCSPSSPHPWSGATSRPGSTQ